MANPWWLLGTLFVLDRDQRKSRIMREQAQRITELERERAGQQPMEPLTAPDNTDDPSGCLGCLGCLVLLVILLVVVSLVVWMVTG